MSNYYKNTITLQNKIKYCMNINYSFILIIMVFNNKLFSININIHLA